MTDKNKENTERTRSSQPSVQDQFLNQCRRDKVSVTVFLVNGVKLQGVITSFDNFSLVLQREAHAQLVYKHAISTVMPGSAVKLAEDDA